MQMLGSLYQHKFTRSHDSFKLAPKVSKSSFILDFGYHAE